MTHMLYLQAAYRMSAVRNSLDIDKSPEQLSIIFPTQRSGLSVLDKFQRLRDRWDILSCELYFAV